MITEIKWKFRSSLNMSTYHHTLYRSDEHPVQMEAITRKTRDGYGLGKCTKSFYIDKDPKEYKSLAELLEAYNKQLEEEEAKQMRIVKD